MNFKVHCVFIKIVLFFIAASISTTKTKKKQKTNNRDIQDTQNTRTCLVNCSDILPRK